MGHLFSKKSTVEVLKDIDKQILGIQKKRKIVKEKLKKYSTYTLACSLGANLIGIVCAFCPWTVVVMIYILVLVILVFLLPFQCYLIWQKKSIEKASSTLPAQKASILENVTETETYNKAKEILEKYDPERLRELEGRAKPKKSTDEDGTQEKTLRRRLTAPKAEDPDGAEKMKIQTPTSSSSDGSERKDKRRKKRGKKTPKSASDRGESSSEDSRDKDRKSRRVKTRSATRSNSEDGSMGVKLKLVEQISHNFLSNNSSSMGAGGSASVNNFLPSSSAPLALTASPTSERTAAIIYSDGSIGAPGLVHQGALDDRYNVTTAPGHAQGFLASRNGWRAVGTCSEHRREIDASF